jgi:hypothetical protein
MVLHVTDSFHWANCELIFLHLCFKVGVKCKHPGKWCTGKWCLYCSPVSAHSALSMQEFQACNGMTLVSHSICSPVIAPCDIFLFLKLKLEKKGKIFYDISIIQKQVQAILEDSWTENISKCFNDGTIAELTVSSLKDTTLKGIAWNIKMLLLLCKNISQKLSDHIT